MPKHPDFTLYMPSYSIQQIHLTNDAGDLVHLVVDNQRDRAVLAGALETCLVIFEVRRKKGK